MDTYWPLVILMALVLCGAGALAAYLVLAAQLTTDGRRGRAVLGWSMVALFLCGIVFGLPAFVLWVDRVLS